jgi:hypothetical protein
MGILQWYCSCLQHPALRWLDQGRAFRASVKAVDVNQPWCRSSVAAYAALAAAARLRLLSSCMRCSSSTMKCMALQTVSAQYLPHRQRKHETAERAGRRTLYTPWNIRHSGQVRDYLWALEAGSAPHRADTMLLFAQARGTS